MFPRGSGRSRKRPIPTTTRHVYGEQIWLSTRVRNDHFRLTPGCENLLEFVRYNHLELGVSAFLRTLVRAPSAKVSHMPKSPSLHMFVGDLNRKFRAQRLPR